MILYLSLAIIASALMALGLLMMKSRSAHLPMAAGANTIGAIVAWIRDPMWLGGLGVQTAGWACYVIAVSNAPVSMVAVMMQGGIALFVVASVVILGERANPPRMGRHRRDRLRDADAHAVASGRRGRQCVRTWQRCWSSPCC